LDIAGTQRYLGNKYNYILVLFCKSLFGQEEAVKQKEVKVKMGCWDFAGGPVVKNLFAVLASAAHILKKKKESVCQCRGQGFDPWSRKIPRAARQLSLCTTTTEGQT